MRPHNLKNTYILDLKGETDMDENKVLINGGDLNEEELSGVSGGAILNNDAAHSKFALRQASKDGVVKELSTAAGAGTQSHFCKKCNKTTAHIVYSGNRMVCSVCGTPPVL